MSDQNDSERVKAAQDLRANEAQKTQKIAKNPDEAWRPDGIHVSVPLGYRDTADVTDDALASLSNLKNGWQRNGALVRVVEDDLYLGRDGSGTRKHANSLKIQQLDPPLIARELSRCARYWKYLGRKENLHCWERTEPPSKVVSLVQSVREYPRVPVLRGIVQAPSIRPDGTILDTPGYDDSTGWYFKPNDQFLPVPESPTAAQVRDSVLTLLEPFAEHPGHDSFPFINASHRWLPVALAMTLLARPSIDGCIPFFGFDATAAGTGKGLVVDLASIIATGSPAAKTTFPVQAEELEKSLSSHAIAGTQLICFDNVSAVIRGDALEKVATTPVVEFRILGASEIRRLAWQSVVAFTGNQLAFHGDTARRVVTCRQETLERLPSQRSNWKYPDVIEWTRTNRPKLVRAALTILRGYAISGDTQSKALVKGFGSFGSWAFKIAASIHWASGVNILDSVNGCRLDLERNDPIVESETNLLLAIALLQDIQSKPQGFSAKELIDIAYQIPVNQELREAFDELLGSHAPKDRLGRPTAKAVGWMLKRRLGARRGNMILRSDGFDAANVRVWRIETMLGV